jgi:hypothetical protein
MKRNNFKRAPEGQPNIECSVFYDTDWSGMDFKENFEILQHSGNRTSSVLYYTDNVNVHNSDGIEFTVKGDKAAKIKALENWYEKEGLENWTDADLDSEIISRYEVNLVDYAQDKLESVPSIEFVPSKNLVVTSSRGYSQGDYSTIIYCPDDLEKAWGRKPDENNMQKTFNHLLWDTPIYASFDINGKEFNIWDMPCYNEYDFKREKFLAWVSEKSGVSVDILSELCPENPDYI